MNRPLVVKLGSSLVVDERGEPRRELLLARAREIAEIVGSGVPVCVVSSGAIAMGLRQMGLERRPRSLGDSPTGRRRHGFGRARPRD